MDLRQTTSYRKYLERLGWIVEKNNGISYFIKKFPLIGHFIKVQRPGKFDINFIEKLIKKYRVFQIVIEPISPSDIPELITYGFKQSKTYFVPSKTILIDLTKSEVQLLKELHHKTRYNIKVAKRNALDIRLSDDIITFADFWQECALKQRGMFLSQKKEIIDIYSAFKNNSDILFAYQGGELLAGLLLIHADRVSYYMYAASNGKGKSLFAPTLLAWEAIMLAKKRGSKLFDFEGVYDARFPIKSWQGFTRFKKSFGGREIEYPGTFHKFLLPF